MIQNADIIFYQCIHDSPKTAHVRPPSFDSPVIGNGPKTNRVARGHDGLPVSSKTPPLPQLRPPLRVNRGETPISFASATPRTAQPCGLAGAPEILEGVADGDPRGQAAPVEGPLPSNTRARETQACWRWLPQHPHGPAAASRTVEGKCC